VRKEVKVILNRFIYKEKNIIMTTIYMTIIQVLYVELMYTVE